MPKSSSVSMKENKKVVLNTEKVALIYKSINHKKKKFSYK